MTLIAEKLAERMGTEELTPREFDVLEQIVRGKSNKEIATELENRPVDVVEPAQLRGDVVCGQGPGIGDHGHGSPRCSFR